ncbi:NAD(P)H-dependent oxidoreductase [Labrys sp. 22185]|uniref:NAD(P)H-dependent oxidoreductase n=1 Tax=Labrys sp. 22185 TaxID=3453888 RepID=UPI003F833B2F
MKKTVLIVYAQPEPSSLTRHLVHQGIELLQKRGHDVLTSDLYAMNWKAVYDADDFPERADVRRLSFIDESRHAHKNGFQTPDVVAEQNKLLAADAVILKFPLWWFSMPAIMKGWVERVYAYNFAYGYQDAGNAFRYGDGILKGKRAMLSVMCGGPAEDYSLRGINGPLDELLFPITHGILFYPGMDVLPTFAIYGTGRLDAAGLEAAEKGWRARLERLFEDKPIAFRRQNGGDFPDRHILADNIAPGRIGIAAHIAE